MARVFVAMSGGVDSSVTAALLLESGHDVTGVTMQLWPSSDDEGGCCSVTATRDARRVCDLLGIPHYVLNYRDTFRREVVVPFADEYAAGRTPNPCIVCNDVVKFADLLGKVTAQGAEFLATGHYARIERDEDGTPWLARAVDSTKDQSYFLYRLTRPQLEHVLFPVGGLSKREVRAIATEIGLQVAEKPDSQEICFAPAGRHADVVAELHPEAVARGKIVDAEGAVLGTHEGIAHYTVGQRKGLGIGGSGAPLYVTAVDADSNRVVVGPRAALGASELLATDVVWHGPAGGEPMRVEAAVRYRMQPIPATARFDGERLRVSLDSAVDAVAPGQAVVCYLGQRVLGGGVIQCAS